MKRTGLMSIAAACMFCVGIILVARVVTQKLVPTGGSADEETATGLPPQLHQVCLKPSDCGGLRCVQWQGVPFVKSTCELPCEPNAAQPTCPAPSRCVVAAHGAGAHCQE